MENELVGGNGFEQVAFVFQILTYCFGVVLALFAIVFSMITIDEGKTKHLTI